MSEIIYTAELNPTTKLRAIALLDLAHPDNGHVTLEWGELSDLWQCSKGTVRRQLGAIHEAGLIHYSSNGDGIVYVTFKHLSRAHARKSAIPRAESARPRAESARPRAENALPEATPPAHADDAARAHARKSAKNSRESARPRALSALPEANYSHACAGALLDGWMDISTTTTNENPSIPPAPQTATTEPVAAPVEADAPAVEAESTALPTAAPTVEQAICLALLLRIRMRADKAQMFAATLPLRTVREAVGAWWMNRKEVGGKYDAHPGIVVHWLENHATPVWPPPPASWQHEALYLDFRTRAERDADEDAERQAAAWSAAQVERTPAAPHPVRTAEPDPEPGTPAALWRQLCSDLSQAYGPGSEPFGADMRLHPGSTLHKLVIVAPRPRLDWMRNRMTNQLQRRARVLAGHDVAVEFVEGEDQ